MDTIKVKKQDLLRVLRSNLKDHVTEYKEAIKAYRVKCADLLLKEIELVKNGKEFTMSFNVMKPVNYQKDYLLMIGMLEMDISDTVELDSMEYNRLVNDEWTWRPNFDRAYSSNSYYVGMTGVHGAAGIQGPQGSSGAYEEGSMDITFSDDEL